MTVETSGIEESLLEAESAVARGEGVSGTGFWRAVKEVKTRPELVDRYADRIAEIDQSAHRNWALLTVPLWFGTTVAIVATLAGSGLVGWAYYLEDLAAVMAFYVGVGVLLGSTHGLAHLIVGRVLGMRFTSWFIGEVIQPQPGVKLDYSTYLRTDPRKRAWMHASGAIVTKAIPFLMIGAAIAAGLPSWAVWILPILGMAMLATDVVWSTGSSDWKKFRRELALAHDS